MPRSTFLVFPLLAVVFFPPTASFAEDFSDPSRERFIQEKLDCVSGAEESRREELCSLSGSDRPAGASSATSESREDIIARALDTVMSEQAAAPAPPQPETTPSPQRQWSEDEAAEYFPAIELKTREVQFGTELYRYSYKEPVFNLEIKGLQYGIFGAYIYRPSKGEALRSEGLNMYKLDARFAFGPVDYSSDPSGQLDDEDNYAFELRGIAGYDHLVNERFLLTGYGGFGFRYLNNDSGGQRSTTGAYGYERVSNYFYFPLGVEAVNQIAHGWKVAANLEWDIFLYGEQTSYLSDVNSGYPDLENNQGRGYGIRGSTRIVKEGKSANLFCEPFFRYWRIHDSEVTTAVGNVYAYSGLEPDNNTTEYGVKFGLQY